MVALGGKRRGLGRRSELECKVVWEGEDLFGRADEVPSWSWGTWLAHLMGWFLTAAAVSLGAPFWFDQLSRVAKLRGTGRRPEGAAR